MNRQQKPEHWTPAAVGVVATLTAIVAVVALRTGLPFKAWGVPVVAGAGAVGTVLFTAVQNRGRYTHIHRTASWLAGGAWVTWTAITGWTGAATVFGAASALILTSAGYACRPRPGDVPASPDDPPRDKRPTRVREWEALLRRRMRCPEIGVTQVIPWDNPEDGEWVYVTLPADGSVEPDVFVAAARGLAVARRLPKGCAITVLDGDHQGELVFEVMLRDSLTDEAVLDVDYSPASVYDEFQVMASPRGESINVCLRSQSMVIGGAPESGKTTLLHRIILHLARCTDALVWVVDTNGGGVASEWLRAWVAGDADRPVIDWVAADDEEAAVLVATATAIAKDRKMSPEANRRKRAGNTRVLPVDEQLPAIVVLNDEGGEVRQTVSVLGQMADQGLSRLAQIGRAEAARVVKSVLRGTSDLLDKRLRVNAALRICLRMEEPDEYAHVLGMSPPKGAALSAKGAAFVKRGAVDMRPILGRTVDVPPDLIEEASAACADLRPELDGRARQVAARLQPRDVLGGRDPAGYPDVAGRPVMRDVAAGLAYENRWQRAAPLLASIRGDDFDDDQSDEPAPQPAVPGPAATSGTGLLSVPEGSAFSRFLAVTGVEPQTQAALPSPAVREVEPETAPGVDLNDPDSVDREALRLLGGLRLPGDAKLTTREHIVAVLTEMYPEPLTSAEIGVELANREAGVSRTYRQDVLKEMRTAGTIVQLGDGRYTVLR